MTGPKKCINTRQQAKGTRHKATRQQGNKATRQKAKGKRQKAQGIWQYTRKGQFENRKNEINEKRLNKIIGLIK